MADASNYALMMDALQIYREAMRLFVVGALEDEYGDLWWEEGVAKHFPIRQIEELEQLLKSRRATDVVPSNAAELPDMLDVNHIKQIMTSNWRKVFEARIGDRQVLDGWVAQVSTARNTLAHWSTGEVPRQDALSFIEICRKVVSAVDEGRAASLQRLWEQVDARRESPDEAAEENQLIAEPRAGLAPWRRVIYPHQLVRQGTYLNSSFAASLPDVVAGRADREYQDPREFFARTYLTHGIQRLLDAALRRLHGDEGEPIFHLKTAFGGGKTHSLLALYHLIENGEASMSHEPVRELVAEAGWDGAPSARCAVLVGTELNPSEPRSIKDLGIELRTLWGELAFQLAGVDGYRMVERNDLDGTAPGAATLLRLFELAGASLVLIDELVAFVRNVPRGRTRVPSGPYSAQLTFLQNLTEAVRRTRNAQLVVSIPESDTEMGGPEGVLAANELEQILGRMDTTWEPVGVDESFEIVRRRLFGELQDEAARDRTCRAFAEIYAEAGSPFPSSAREAAYERRMRDTYPIHPEVFDRLYEDWSTLERFQRTRGVLRLMAAVLHYLWMGNDQSPLVMPGSLPLRQTAVRNELTSYLGDQWYAVIDSDVEGSDATPNGIDAENPRFGSIDAAARLARTILLGSSRQEGQRGIEYERVMLGALQPGEAVSDYSDALGRMRQRCTYLYAPDERRYWYAAQANLNRTVADRRSRVSQADADAEIIARLSSRRGREPFGGVHWCPSSSSDVGDEAVARLVVLRPEHPHEPGLNDASLAIAEARTLLAQRGDIPRQHRNMLVFLAADAEEVPGLREQAVQYLAWSSVHQSREELGLDASQERQAQHQTISAENSLESMIDHAYRVALVPVQDPDADDAPAGHVEWETRVVRQGGVGDDKTIVGRAADRLSADELLIGAWSPLHLQRELDRWIWSSGSLHIALRDLWSHFATYLYLPRLRDQQVLIDTIRDGVRSLDYFGYADGVEDSRYRGLKFGEVASVLVDDSSVVVRPEVAAGQQPATTGEAGGSGTGPSEVDAGGPDEDSPVRPRRFFAVAELEATHVGTVARRIEDEVIQHLAALLEADVRVTLEIQARVPGAEGIPDHVVRTIRENAGALEFRQLGFEEE